MKSTLPALLAVAMVATTAHGAVLSMNWSGTDSQVIFLGPGESANIEIWVTLAPGDDLINYFGGNETDPEMILRQTGVTTSVPGWIDASVGGFLGAPGQQVSVGTPGAVSPISGGTFLIAEQTIRAEDFIPFAEITFDHESVGLLDLTGGAYTFGPMLAGVVPHFFTYGTGSPGVADGGLGGSPRDPLFIIPEPASFAFLALGGFALLRRR